MPAVEPSRTATGPSRLWSLAIAGAVAGGLVFAGASRWPEVTATAHLLGSVLWVLPWLVALHLFQLLIAGLSWRSLVSGTSPGLATFYRLRIIREAIDSLLPVAQIGGEVVGARLLSGRGVAPGVSAASVVVDVTIELLTQTMFLAAGLGALTLLSRASVPGLWIAMGLAAALAAATVLVQRMGALRLLEALLDGIARRWPGLGQSSLHGLQRAASEIYRRPGALWRCAWLHQLAWTLGSLETWAVLNALKVPTSPAMAFVIESIGMAGRSAGFAIPAALGVQEGGFVLAAALVGVAVLPALALSLAKRIREILVGIIGLALWRLAAESPVSTLRAGR